MLHYGKNSDNELELHLTGSDIAVLYRAILSAGLQERRALYGVKQTIEQDFREDITDGENT
jgi:hypothetical protein